MAINIGEKIKEMREEHHLIQEELALKLGVTGKAVSKWETGGGLPDITQVIPLTQVFGVSADALFDLPVYGIDDLLDALIDTQQLKRRGGDYIEAAAKCERIGYGIINNSKNIDDICMTHSYLVTLYSELGQINKAVENANALPKKPVSADALLGVIKAENGDPEGALPHFVSSLAYSLSSAVQSFIDIAQVYFSREDYKNAIRCHIAVLDVINVVYGENTCCPPLNIYAMHDFIAESYYRLGDDDSTLDWLEKCFEFRVAQMNTTEKLTHPLVSELKINSNTERERWKYPLKYVYSGNQFKFERVREHERFVKLLEAAEAIN